MIGRGKTAHHPGIDGPERAGLAAYRPARILGSSRHPHCGAVVSGKSTSPRLGAFYRLRPGRAASALKARSEVREESVHQPR